MKHLEDREQMAVMEWAGVQRITIGQMTGQRVSEFLFHIPNGGRRGKREAARFKRMGVKPGVSDLFFALPVGEYNGLWIEMKKQWQDFPSQSAAISAFTLDQEDWLMVMSIQYFGTSLAYGSGEAIDSIEAYMRGEEVCYEQRLRQYKQGRAVQERSQREGQSP